MPFSGYLWVLYFLVLASAFGLLYFSGKDRPHVLVWTGVPVVLSAFWLQDYLLPGNLPGAVLAGLTNFIVGLLPGFSAGQGGAYQKTLLHSEMLAWLAANLVLAWEAAVLALTARWLGPQPGPRPVADTKVRPDFLHGQAMRHLYLAAFAVTLLCWLLLSLLLPVEWDAFFRNGLAKLKGVVWADLAVLACLIWTASRAYQAAEPAMAGLPAAQVQSTIDLEPLFQKHLAEDRAGLLFSRKSLASQTRPVLKAPGAKGPDEPPSQTVLDRFLAVAKSQGHDTEALRGRLGNLDQLWDQPERTDGGAIAGLLCMEDLSHLHFLLLAELVLSCQDRGGVALVLMPVWAFERVKRVLLQVFGENCKDIPLAVWKGGEPVLAKQRYGLLIMSDQHLEEELRDNREAFDSALKRLEFLAVLEFPGLDASLLRLRLSRLQARSQMKAFPELRVFCQGQYIGGLDDKVARVFDTLGRHKFDPVELIGHGEVTQYLLVWNNSAQAAKSLLASAGRQDDIMDRLSEISPAILSRAWIMGYSAQLADKFGRYDLRLWDQRFPKLMDMTKSGSAIRANVPEEANFDDYPDENTRVILIEDLNNLALAITSDPNFNRSDAMMLHVVSHNYPMRGFFVDKLTLATSFDAFFAQNLPLATDPSGSIIELAQTLATEFNNRNEISQNDLAHYFVEIPPGVQTTFDVYPTLMGLQNLFGQIGEKTGDFQESRQQPHRKSFKLISPMAIPRVTVPVQTVEADAKKIGYLSCSDHGLAYGRGTKTSFNGRTYVISKIDDAKIVVEARAFQSGPRPSYFFANNYTIHVSGSDTAFEIPLTFGRTAAQLLQTRAFLRGKVVRRTVGMLEVGESGRRFGPHVPQWRHGEEVEHTQEHPHAAMILLCLSGKDKRLETLTGLRLSRAAFTLAATLQDLMFSLFAIVGHRIAVLTPQAQEAIATAQMTQEDQSAGEYQRFPAERYPRLVADAAASGRETGPMDAQAWTATLYSFIGESLKSSADFDDPGKNILSLVIVEDSDHDLGALRHVFADWPMVLQRWGDYVTWLDLNKDKPDFYYRFGGDQLSSLFDFAAAAQIIAVMRNPDMGQKRGKT